MNRFLRIREAIISDLPYVSMMTLRVLIETQRMQEYLLPDVLSGCEECLQGDQGCKYLLAEDRAGRILGQLKIAWGWNDLTGCETGVLEHVFAHPDARGQGVFETLYRAALEHLRSRGIRRCHLHVISSNSSAIRAYTKRGFQNTGHWMTRKI